MTKNPLLNALAASAYIVLIASVMYFGTRNVPGPDNSVFAPIVALSILTLSAAVMGYIFFYQPVLLFLEGKKKAAVDLFVRTVGVFAVITALLLTLFFSGIIR